MPASVGRFLFGQGLRGERLGRSHDLNDFFWDRYGI
jgi:hypothetical protein